MHHLILGYGYCGYHLAQELINNQQPVTVISRHLNPEFALSQLRHVACDLKQPVHWDERETIIYYLIPPSPQGEQDDFLKQFLCNSQLKAKKVIYFSSSGVYGNHQGSWVSEETICLGQNPRQMRRLDAEQQWTLYCQQQQMELVIMRVAGIYGPNRLPMAAALAQTPLIERERVPYTNYIYVNDLARITFLLGQIPFIFPLYNIADGSPQPMGTLQQKTAQLVNVPPAPYESWANAWDRASPMKREFMQDSKRLNIDRLRIALGKSFSLTDLNQGIKDSL